MLSNYIQQVPYDQTPNREEQSKILIRARQLILCSVEVCGQNPIDKMEKDMVYADERIYIITGTNGPELQLVFMFFNQ